MKKYMKSTFIFVVFLPTLVLCEVRITPVVRSSVLGGQYFFENESTSFGGNVNIFTSPVINFGQKHALIPLLFLSYRGTKDVRELVGGGTLTQECVDIGPIGLKYVYKLSPEFKIKLKTTYKIEYIKETKDEDWQHGLFDYNKLNLSGEIENIFAKSLLLRAGVDYYIMRYPNYQSLVSKNEYRISIDTTTYTEISENAGKDVLDYSGIDCFIESNYRLTDNLIFQLFYNISLKNFFDQHIVNSIGKFEKTLRKDISHIFRLSSIMNFERISITISDTIKYYDSNQNSYDASFTKFTENSYDYIENTLSPYVKFNLGSEKPYITFSLWWDIVYRNYLTRLAQGEEGDYTDEKLWQQMNVLGISFNYPLTWLLKGLSFKIVSSYNIVYSNMKYEKFYKYNYNCYNYFAGIEFEF